MKVLGRLYAYRISKTCFYFLEKWCYSVFYITFFFKQRYYSNYFNWMPLWFCQRLTIYNLDELYPLSEWSSVISYWYVFKKQAVYLFTFINLFIFVHCQESLCCIAPECNLGWSHLKFLTIAKFMSDWYYWGFLTQSYAFAIWAFPVHSSIECSNSYAASTV